MAAAFDGDALLCKSDPPRADSHTTRTELIRIITTEARSDTELYALIRRCSDLCDDDQNSVWHHLVYPEHRPLLILAALTRLAAPAVRFPLYDDSDNGGPKVFKFKEMHVALALTRVAEQWTEQRYVGLAHAEIRRLWRDLNAGPLTDLIID